MNKQKSIRKVDHTALKVNQTLIIIFLVAGFILDNLWLVAFIGLVMLVGTAFPSLALFKRVYQHLLKPSGLVKPHVIADNPEPHLFAQGLGGIVLALATAALLAGAATIGWILTWLVIILAALNLFLGFCAGCFIYYQLNRLGIPGFGHRPLKQ